MEIIAHKTTMGLNKEVGYELGREASPPGRRLYLL
jgi:hypothetical protein